MQFDDFNPYSDPVARQLHDANTHLRGVRDQLWELGQPPEVRAEIQARHDEHARTTIWDLRVVGGVALAWVVLATLFGTAGTRVFGGLLSLAWGALEVVLVLGFFLVIGQALWRGVRRLAGRPGGDR